jgi:hypothetical protein
MKEDALGFRFRKSIGILPGLRLNISKTGVSTSIGRPGGTVNIRGRRVRTTVGLPGSGLSYSQDVKLAESERTDEAAAPAAAPNRTLGMRLLRRLFAGTSSKA